MQMVFQVGNTLGSLRRPGLAWNTGLTKETSPILAETGRKISVAVTGRTSSRKGVTLSEETKLKCSLARKGRHFPKLSDVKKGKPTWNKGVCGYHNSPYPPSYHRSRIGLIPPHNHIELPTRPERKLEEIISIACPGEYRYTGDFSFVIMGKCPDFTNVNGQKKVIEMFGDYWHPKGSEAERIDTFKSFGYECLVIWESDLRAKSKDTLIQEIRQFNMKEERVGGTHAH